MLPISKSSLIVRKITSNSQINGTVSLIANQARKLKNHSIGIPNTTEKSISHNKKSTNNVHFSPMCEIKHYDANDAIDLLKIQPNQKNPLSTETKKTVHLKDIQQLEKDMNVKINNLNNRITPLISNNGVLHSNDIIKMQSEFNAIVTSLNDCQVLLNNSSYPHHKRKQKILTSLKNQMLKIEYQLKFEKFITEKQHTVPLHIK